MGGFHLSKWYMDCTADDGSAFIGYWARLRWRSLALEYAAALLAPVGEEPRQVHAIRSLTAPVLTDNACTWRCAPLGLEGQWSADAAPIHLDLLQTPAGGIRWSIHQPRAHARVQFLGSEREMSGLGYVEELELTLPPWRLPFDELYWGRFLSADHTLVWLQWEKRYLPETRRRFAVLNGVPDEGTTVTEAAVHLPGAGAKLCLNAPRPLREGHLVATVLGAVPGVLRLLPKRFQGAHEAKRLSRAELKLAGQAPAEGWSIYEVVRW